MFNAYPDYLLHTFGYENLENSSYAPSEVHFNDYLTAYNFKYLFQRAQSIFKFTLPETWEVNFFLNTLYAIGWVIVLDTDEYGIVPQFGNLYGYDLQYQPAFATVVNPIFTPAENIRYSDMRVWEKCGLIRLSMQYSGVYDICRHYAELLSVAQTSLQTNLINTKFAYVFGAKNKTGAESLKRLYDDIASGKPAVFVDKQLYDENGNLPVTVFSQNVESVYIGGNLLNDIRGILNDFDSMVGIPNANLAKKERLITDEANMNNFETKALCYGWKEMLDRDIKRVNAMYGTSIKCEFRKEVVSSASSADNDIDPV